jgi:hypothetical protein
MEQKRHDPRAASSDAPALASFKDAVYLAFKGESDDKIWLSKYTDKDGWGVAKSPQALAVNDLQWQMSDLLTSRGPAVGVGDTGRIHILWKDKSNKSCWESACDSGKSDWSPQGTLLTIETDARPALASQTSSATQILLAWKDGSNTDLWAHPVDRVPEVWEIPPPADETNLFWSLPAGATPPASVSGAAHNIGMGSGPTESAVAASLVLSSDGKATFAGWFQDQGTIPIFDAPAQDYNAVMVVMTRDKKAFTFTRTKNAVPTGGAIDTWNITQNSDAIKKYWTSLTTPQATHCKANFSVNSDLGSLLDAIISDLKELFGYVEDAVEVIGVVASVAA